MEPTAEEGTLEYIEQDDLRGLSFELMDDRTVEELERSSVDAVRLEEWGVPVIRRIEEVE